MNKLINIKLIYLISVSGLYNHTTKFKAITTTDMKSDDEEEESSLENNSEFGLDQIGSNLSKMDQNGSSAKDPIIALLSEYCHSKVLNIDYLLGKSSQPFTNKAANKAKTTSLKRKRSSEKKLSYENQNTHLKNNINNPQALSSPPSSSTSLTVSDASSSAVSSPSLPKSGSVSPRPESIIGKLI